MTHKIVDRTQANPAREQVPVRQLWEFAYKYLDQKLEGQGKVGHDTGFCRDREKRKETTTYLYNTIEEAIASLFQTTVVILRANVEDHPA